MSRHRLHNDGPEYAQLNRREEPQGYRALKKDALKFKSITFVFDKETIVTGIATQGYGDPTVQEWVEEYTLHMQAASSSNTEWVTNQDGEVVRTHFTWIILCSQNICFILFHLRELTNE